jgi:hypothetical protein
MSDTTQRPLIAVAREKILESEEKFIAQNLIVYDYARFYVAGYDAAMQEEADILTLANQRIAELEALNAHLRREYSQLAARPQVTGVVVTHDMVERAYDAWRATIVGGDAFRNALAAALTSATLVPLASAEPVRWYSANSDSTTKDSERFYNAIPLYRGVRDGE